MLKANASADVRLDEALRELQQLIGEILHSLKRVHFEEDLEPMARTFFDAGLRDRHARVLFTLAITGPLTVGELAERMGLAPATTSLLAGELDRAGFLVRHEDDEDRRRTILSLPERHRALLEELVSAKMEPMRRTLRQLEPTARAHFLQGLRLLAVELDKEEP